MRRPLCFFLAFLACFSLFSSLTPILERSLFLVPGSCQAAEEAEYVIGPGDVLSIMTRARTDLSGSFVVSPGGTISLSLLGDVKVSDLTPSQLSKELTRRLSVFGVGEAVVTVTQYNSRKIFVVGAVAKPGKYAFSAIPSLWDVISEAGGPSADAVLSAVQIIRAGTGQVLTIDVGKLLGGEAVEPVKLLPGDTVRVPGKLSASRGESTVNVLGEVRSSGTYEVASAKDVVGAVVLAGGPTELADLKKVTIVRPGGASNIVLKVNLEKFLKEGMILGNPELRPGDTVMVPRKRTTLATIFSLAGIATVLSAVASIAIITSR